MAKKKEQELKTNYDKKIRQYQLKDVLTTVYVMLYIAVIVLEILALFKVISFIYGLIIFVISIFIKSYLTKKI